MSELCFSLQLHLLTFHQSWCLLCIGFGLPQIQFVVSTALALHLTLVWICYILLHFHLTWYGFKNFALYVWVCYFLPHFHLTWYGFYCTLVCWGYRGSGRYHPPSVADSPFRQPLLAMCDRYHPWTKLTTGLPQNFIHTTRTHSTTTWFTCGISTTY